MMRPIPGYPGYFATENGEVFSKRSGSLRMLQTQLKKGYKQVHLGEKKAPVHQLVCAAFHGPKPDADLETRHKDGHKLNNTPSNLEWCTHDVNLEDNVLFGLFKLNHEKVAEIKRLLVAGEPVGEVANLFGVSGPTVSQIANCKSWKNSGNTPEFLDWWRRGGVRPSQARA